MNRSVNNSSAANLPRRRRWLLWATAVFTGILTSAMVLNRPADELPTESETIQIAQAADTERESDPSDEPAIEAATQPLDQMPEDDLQSVKLNELISQSVVDAAEHPLDPVLMVAQWSMDAIDRNIQDYTCRITSQVFIHGRLDKERQMDAKIRHEQKANETNELSEPLPATDSVPFSVYLNFVAPRHIKGQEVIWVEGRNDGKMIAHAGSGLLRVKRMHLSPDGPIAMRGSRYPIWQVGFRNLIGKMHEIGCCDRDHEDCRVVVTPGIEVQSRRCTLIEIFHDEPKECFQFHHAKIYVDQERQIPIGYEGYGWPENPEDPPPLFEKFYYTDVQLNPGLSDIDFSPDNPAYNYPRW